MALLRPRTDIDHGINLKSVTYLDGSVQGFFFLPRGAKKHRSLAISGSDGLSDRSRAGTLLFVVDLEENEELDQILQAVASHEARTGSRFCRRPLTGPTIDATSSLP